MLKKQETTHRPEPLAQKKESVGPSSRSQPLGLVEKIQSESSTVEKISLESQSTDNLILTNWSQVVDSVVQQHPNIGTFLKMGMLVRIDESQVVIGYPKAASVACSRIQKDENRNVICKVFEQITGRPIQVLVVELSENQGKGPTIGEWQIKKRE